MKTAYCREHGVRNDECGCAHRLLKPLTYRRHLQAVCLCGWVGPKFPKEMWDLAYREGRSHISAERSRSEVLFAECLIDRRSIRAWQGYEVVRDIL